MRLFDLVFIALFLTFVAGLVLVAVALIRGNRARAGTIARRLATALAAYMILVVTVAMVSPQRTIALGTDQCADDWCIAADSVHRDANGAQATYTVSLQVSSRARRVTQREHFVVAYLRDADGRRFDALPDANAVPFDTLLRPGEAIRTTRRYIVPANAQDVGLVIAREGGFDFPGCCIIGDEGSLLHKRTVVRLDSSR